MTICFGCSGENGYLNACGRLTSFGAPEVKWLGSPVLLCTEEFILAVCCEQYFFLTVSLIDLGIPALSYFFRKLANIVEESS
jgi:hypothetical protein